MIELTPDDFDAEEDSDGQFCECDFTPTFDEANEGRCFCCGKSLGIFEK